MSRQFVTVDESTGTPLRFFILDEAPEGAEANGETYHEVLPALDIFPPLPPSPTHKLHWEDGKLQWVETWPLASLLVEALARCYTDIDAVVFDAVGNRGEEYKEAEVEARAFIDSGCAEPAPQSVQTFAKKNPTMQVRSNEWAARQVIGRADALAAAKRDMRDQRFISQYDMRAATTVDELNLAVKAWSDFIASTRAALGLSK